MVLIAWIVIFIAGLYAQSLILSHHIIQGLFLYVIDASFAVLLIHSSVQSPQEKDAVLTAFINPIPAWKKKIRWILFPLIFLAMAATPVFIILALNENKTTPEYYTYALYTWLTAFLFIFSGGFMTAWKDLIQFPKKALIPLAMLLLLSLLIGLFRLTDAPPAVHGDEGMVGIYAREILQGNISTFFSTSWYSIPQFFFFLPACGLYLFGDNLWGLRMETVCLGTLSIIPFYFLARSWWGSRAAVFGSILLITNHWFIHLMHCGVNYGQVSFFTITLLALWNYSNQRRSIELLLVSGAVMGLSLLSYQANHILPILWAASQLWLFTLRKISFRWVCVSISIPLVIAIWIVSPLVIRDIQTSGKTEIFSSRSRDVVIWSPQNKKHLESVYRANGDTSLVFQEQVKRGLLSTILYPDKSIQYNGRKPFLERCTAVLFVLGILAAWYRFFEPRWSIPAGWLLAILLAGGALTIDAPFYPRLAGITTLLFLPITGVLSFILQPRTEKNLPAIVFAVLILLISSGMNLNHYFNVYTKTISPLSVHYPQTQMANIINQRDSGEFNYIFNGPHFAFNSGTVKFLIPSRQGKDYDRIPSQWKQNCAFFADPSQSQLLPALKDAFPAYTIREHKNPEGILMFTSLTQDEKR